MAETTITGLPAGTSPADSDVFPMDQGGIVTNKVTKLLMFTNPNLPATASATVGVINQGGARFIHSFNSNNTFVGGGSGNFTLTGFRNSGLGNGVLNDLTSGNDNTVVGWASSSLTTGSTNTFLGSAITGVVTGSRNLLLGYAAGSGYSAAESNNIIIANNGVPGESNVCRIGATGAGTGQISVTYLAGLQVHVDDGSLLVGANSNIDSTNDSNFISGASNETAGGDNLISGTLNAIGTTTESCAILGGQSNEIANASNFCAVVGGTQSLSGDTGSVCLAGNQATIVGDYSLGGWLASLTSSNYSMAFGRGTFSGSESVFLTDQNSAYAPGSLSQTFYARFTQGMNLNTVTISSAGAVGIPADLTLAANADLIFNGGSGTNNVTVPNNLADALSISDVSGNNYFTIVSTTATPHISFTQTIQMFSGQIVGLTSVTTATYTALYDDYLLACNRAGTIAITLIASPETGRTYRIKDTSGAAASNNITITPAAGNIDGAANYVITSNYGSIDVVYNGTSWSIL